jgi:hypothetical protein
MMIMYTVQLRYTDAYPIRAFIQSDAWQYRLSLFPLGTLDVESPFRLPNPSPLFQP